LLHLIVACTNLKRAIPSDALRMRTYTRSQETLEAVVVAWRGGRSRGTELVAAVDLYKGGYWSGVRDLHQAGHSDLTIHVMSAGFGLCALTQPLPAYSATFLPGDPDSVPGAREVRGRQEWWKALGGRDALSTLLEQDSEARLLLALPASYLAVVEPELEAIAKQHGPERMTIFSTKSASPVLAASWVPLDARMVRTLGTNTSGLLIAGVKRCLDSGSGETLYTVSANETLAPLRDQDAPPLYPKRERQSEALVRQWIQAALSSPEPPTSASAALRRFRDEGLAFEQKHFGRVFRDVVATESVQGTLI
jgi:hypothetical protein